MPALSLIFHRYNLLINQLKYTMQYRNKSALIVYISLQYTFLVYLKTFRIMVLFPI